MESYHPMLFLLIQACSDFLPILFHTVQDNRHREEFLSHFQEVFYHEADWILSLHSQGFLIVQDYLCNKNRKLRHAPLRFELDRSYFLNFQPSPILLKLLLSILLLHLQSFPAIQDPLFLPEFLPPVLPSPADFPFPAVLQVPDDGFPDEKLHFPACNRQF